MIGLYDLFTSRILFAFLWSVFFRLVTATNEFGANSVYGAVVNISYRDPTSGEWRSQKEELGTYGSESLLESEWGRVVHVRTAGHRTDGCVLPINVPTYDRWIALVEKGNCSIQQKINNVVSVKNLSAVVVYGHDVETEPFIFKIKVDDVVLIFMSKQNGDQIASLADNASLNLMMYISVGGLQHHPYSHINKTSVLFVSISFIILMIISLAWLVFYYIQRFRYSHTKDRLTKHLLSAAKKALNRIPQKTIRKYDIELQPEFDLCAICVENYKISDVVRILSCRHVFHKYCVDRWLLEQRTCPICKMDILQAYGIKVGSIQEPFSTHLREAYPVYRYLEASTLLLDDNLQGFHSVELAQMCPRPYGGNTIIAEADVEHIPDSDSNSPEQYPLTPTSHFHSHHQTSV